MALTAMATVSTRKFVCRMLGMVESSVIATTPNHHIIYYSVKKKGGSACIEDAFSGLVKELCKMTWYAMCNSLLSKLQRRWLSLLFCEDEPRKRVSGSCWST